MTQQQTQGQYEQSMTIHAPAEQIFDFVSDVRNLPKYLPTTKHAEPQQGERVRVQGNVEGHTYDADGFLRADRSSRRMEWGADEHYYSGHLQITPQGDNASNVSVHLSFRSQPPGSDANQGPTEAEINDGIMRALRSIENEVTGKGGKVEAPQSS